jgi:hypothetical protein
MATVRGSFSACRNTTEQTCLLRLRAVTSRSGCGCCGSIRKARRSIAAMLAVKPGAHRRLGQSDEAIEHRGRPPSARPS